MSAHDPVSFFGLPLHILKPLPFPASEPVLSSAERNASTNPTKSTKNALEQKWISIPPNVWHQVVVPEGDDWVVVSFHTVPAEDLIEERPEVADPSQTRQRLYLVPGERS